MYRALGVEFYNINQEPILDCCWPEGTYFP
jgi:hypothetical protein